MCFHRGQRQAQRKRFQSFRADDYGGGKVSKSQRTYWWKQVQLDVTCQWQRMRIVRYIYFNSRGQPKISTNSRDFGDGSGEEGNDSRCHQG